MSDIVAREFRSPKSKLARARHHLATLHQEMSAYANRIKGELRIERLTEDDGPLYQRALRGEAHRRGDFAVPPSPPSEPIKVYVHRLYMTMPCLDDVNVIAADAVQNLRQVLDHAACSCARSLGKTDKGTWFPLVPDGEDMDAALRDKARKLPPTIVQIMKLAAPPGGSLYGLHQLGLVDKHRAICEVECDAAPDMQRMAAGPGWIASGFNEDEWELALSRVNFAMSSSSAERDYNFRFSVGIRFREGTTLAGKHVVETLNNLADAIDGIVGEMEREMHRIVTLASPTRQ